MSFSIQYRPRPCCHYVLTALIGVDGELFWFTRDLCRTMNIEHPITNSKRLPHTVQVKHIAGNLCNATASYLHRYVLNQELFYEYLTSAPDIHVNAFALKIKDPHTRIRVLVNSEPDSFETPTQLLISENGPQTLSRWLDQFKADTMNLLYSEPLPNIDNLVQFLDDESEETPATISLEFKETMFYLKMGDHLLHGCIGKDNNLYWAGSQIARVLQVKPVNQFTHKGSPRFKDVSLLPSKNITKLITHQTMLEAMRNSKQDYAHALYRRLCGKYFYVSITREGLPYPHAEFCSHLAAGAQLFHDWIEEYRVELIVGNNTFHQQQHQPLFYNNMPYYLPRRTPLYVVPRKTSGYTPNTPPYPPPVLSPFPQWSSPPPPPQQQNPSQYTPTSPHYTPASPSYVPPPQQQQNPSNSPQYTPASPSYVPPPQQQQQQNPSNSPSYVSPPPLSPSHEPTPSYTPASPSYVPPPPSPSHEPTPRSPQYSPSYVPRPQTPDQLPETRSPTPDQLPETRSPTPALDLSKEHSDEKPPTGGFTLWLDAVPPTEIYVFQGQNSYRYTCSKNSS